jgi:hypothetical protein
MRIDAIDIEEHILDKIETKHGVTFEECEEVVFSRARRVRRSKRELFKVFGPTSAGRYLLVLVASSDLSYWWVVTARDMTRSERRHYDRSIGR